MWRCALAVGVGLFVGCGDDGVQVPGYDFARLTDRVSYRDNGTNLDTTSLPVPDETTPGIEAP